MIPDAIPSPMPHSRRVFNLARIDALCIEPCEAGKPNDPEYLDRVEDILAFNLRVCSFLANLMMASELEN